MQGFGTHPLALLWMVCREAGDAGLEQEQHSFCPSLCPWNYSPALPTSSLSQANHYHTSASVYVSHVGNFVESTASLSHRTTPPTHTLSASFKQTSLVLHYGRFIMLTETAGRHSTVASLGNVD